MVGRPLFLDQDAIPTIVEVKRSSDTRIRREVVGQMLDYAANAVLYWPADRLRASFEANHENPDEVLGTVLGVTDCEQFWQSVKTNLQAGKVRLVFVAGEIPTELRRIVEFLNTQMDPAQVLAVEIKQYVGEGRQALVPRVIGQTAQAQAKAGGPSGPRDEPSFFAELTTQKGAADAAVARKILDWANSRALGVRWGKGNFHVSHTSQDSPKNRSWLLSIYNNAIVYVHFGDVQLRPPFDEESKRLEWLHRLNQVPGLSIPTDRVSRYASVPLSKLRDNAVLQQFLSTCDWALHEMTGGT